MAVLPSIPTKQQMLCEWLGIDSECGVFKKLYKSGWLQYYQGEGYSMHPIISYVVKVELTPSFEDCQQMIKALAKALIYDDAENACEVLRLLPYGQYVADYFIDLGELNLSANPLELFHL